LVIRFIIKENRRNKVVKLNIEKGVYIGGNMGVKGILEVEVDGVMYKIWSCRSLRIDVVGEEMMKEE